MNDKINSFKEHLIETMWIIWKIRAILQARIQNSKQVFNLFQELENNEDFKALDKKNYNRRFAWYFWKWYYW